MLINSKNKKYGISLITLVITIVVVIILAAAVLLSLSKNNPIDNARIANLTQSKDSIESGVLAYTSRIKAKTLAEFETEDIILGNNTNIENDRIVEKDGDTYKSCKITINGQEVTLYKLDETKFKEQVGELQRKPSSNSDWYLDKNGKAYLLFKSIDEVPNWMKNKEDVIDNATLNKFVIVNDSCSGTTPPPTPSTPVTPEEVAENATEYYGKVVENYNAQGIEWKIFHSDGENIYLITSEYIDLAPLPASAAGGTKPENTDEEYPKAAPLTNVLGGYSSGSEAIDTSNPARKWLKSYFDYLSANNTTSGSNSNMKAVAYMLDTEKWSSFADNTYAEYAIGGPTVEMLFASYNKKHTDVDYRAEVKGVTGYKISKNGGTDWANYYSGMLSTSDDLYVLSSSSGANCMWLASPSYDGSSSCVMVVGYNRWCPLP